MQLTNAPYNTLGAHNRRLARRPRRRARQRIPRALDPGNRDLALSQPARLPPGRALAPRYGYMMPLLDAPLADVRRNFEVNVFGLLAVTQAFFPLLRAAGGRVVNQSSIAGLSPGCQPFLGTYSSSKAAVTAMSNAMRVEFEPFGVKVRDIVLFLSGKLKVDEPDR